jgi:hypothetical protein
MTQLAVSPPMLCLGHSHVACVARAAALADVPLQALNFWSIPGAIVRDRDTPRFSAQFEMLLQAHSGPVFSMIGGAAHGVLGVLVHPRRFDFVLPAQPELALDAAAEVLPANAVRAVLKLLMADYLALMSELRRVCRGRLFHIEPPPPFADDRRMQADIPWAMYPGMCQEISPAPLRYKLWRLHSQIVGDWCDAAGASLVACPAQTVDEAGFLREAFYGDGAHANAAYGDQVLAQMRQLA